MSLGTYVRVAGQRSAWLLRGGMRVGYVGGAHENLGDKCMATAAHRLLAGCTVLPYVYDALERRLGHAGLSGTRYFRAVVLGGGTLINPYGYGITRRAAEQGIATFAAGTGAGSGGFSQPSEVDLSDWAPLLKSFVRVGVRGPLSQRLLQDVGVRNCEIVGDLALALTRTHGHPASENPRTFGLNAIVPHGHARFGEMELAEIGNAVRSLVSRGWTPIAFAMSPTDEEALIPLLRRSGFPSERVRHPASAAELMDLLAGCTAVVSMRLHGSVLASCAGVPPIMIAYLDKCRDFAQTMEVEDLVVDIESVDASRIIECVQHVTQQGQTLRDEVLGRAREWRARLEAYFDDIRRHVALNHKSRDNARL